MLFTIFTGTYNSERVIHRVFDSIENQTLKDFEWIVIDDRSQDDTVNLVKDFVASHPEVQVKLIEHKKNKGVAFSRKEALEASKSKYFVTWDHDDIQSSIQLETFWKLWQKYDGKEIANIFAKIEDQHGNFLGARFPKDGYISDYITMHNRYLVGHKSSGNVVEHHVCVKPQKYLEVINYYAAQKKLLHNRLPNGGDIWGMMAYLGYKTIYSNSVVRTYYIDEPERKSMSSAKRKDGADGVFRYKLLWVNLFDPKLSWNEWKWKLRNIFAVMMYGSLAGHSLGKILSEIEDKSKKVLGGCLYLFAYLLANKYKNEK